MPLAISMLYLCVFFYISFSLYYLLYICLSLFWLEAKVVLNLIRSFLFISLSVSLSRSLFLISFLYRPPSLPLFAFLSVPIAAIFSLCLHFLSLPHFFFFFFPSLSVSLSLFPSKKSNAYSSSMIMDVAEYFGISSYNVTLLFLLLLNFHLLHFLCFYKDFFFLSSILFCIYLKIWWV